MMLCPRIQTQACRIPWMNIPIKQNCLKQAELIDSDRNSISGCLGWEIGGDCLQWTIKEFSGVVKMLCISIVAVVRNSHILRKKFSPKDMFTDFRERGREGETLIRCLPHMPWPRIEPATQECALTGDRTHNFLVHGWRSNQLSHQAGAQLTYFCQNLFTEHIMYILLHIHYSSVKMIWNKERITDTWNKTNESRTFFCIKRIQTQKGQGHPVWFHCRRKSEQSPLRWGCVGTDWKGTQGNF